MQVKIRPVEVTMKNFVRSLLALGAVVAVPDFAVAESVTVDVHSVSAAGVGKKIGTITFGDTAEGLSIKPELSGLPAGERGFHIHQNPSCEAQEKDGVMTAAQAAGPHYDPHSTGKHLGPHGGGHAGDLPALSVDSAGKATTSVVVKGLKLSDIRNRSVMIHAGGDNYSDAPAPLGGGGARIACGVITGS